MGGLRVLGIDLAWADATTANETGVVAAEPDGTIVAAGWTIGVEETVAWANMHATDAAMLFVDTPLVVLNADKQRLCEKQGGQRYGRWKVSANSTKPRQPASCRDELQARTRSLRLDLCGRHRRPSAGWPHCQRVLPIHDDCRHRRVRLRERTTALQAQAEGSLGGGMVARARGGLRRAHSADC